MTNTTYNGWTNYATWRVNLEMFDGWDADQLDALTMGDTYNLPKQLKDYAEQFLSDTNPQGLALDYAFAFLGEVNWYEIAQRMVNDHALEN